MTPTLPQQIVTSEDVMNATLKVSGMKCAGCVRAVEQSLLQQSGVATVSVNLITESALVQYHPQSVTPIELAEKLTEQGFPTQFAQPEASTPRLEAETPQTLDRQRSEVVMAGLLVLLSGLGHLDALGWFHLPGLGSLWFHWGLATLTLIGPGRGILIEGGQGLWRRMPNMNTLVGLGTLTAYLTSCLAFAFPQLGWECFFDEPVMLIGFILVGRLLEQQARTQAMSDFQALISLQPKVARRISKDLAFQNRDRLASIDDLENGNATEISAIPVRQVQVGDWLQVLPGDSLPVDGIVLAGQTTIDESMLTGESLPVVKQPGDALVAGTLNQTGLIYLEATRTGEQTTLAQIIKLVETAQSRKAPIQTLADTVAGYFVYGVLAIAVLTFAFWDLIGTHVWPQVLTAHPNPLQAFWGMSAHHHAAESLSSPLLLSLKLAIGVLVVSCPCALGLATPTAILVGTSLGAEQGLLIRGGDVLEQIHALDTIVFDKTGTLTTGHPVVTDCWVTDPIAFDCLPVTEIDPVDRLLQVAASVESGTSHPLAVAVQQQAKQRGLANLAASDCQTVPGLGISAQIAGQLVLVGSDHWLQQHRLNLDESLHVRSQTLIEAGNTVIWVTISGVIVGGIAVQDSLRTEAADVVAELQRLGLEVRLLTGDQPVVAQAIAQALNLPFPLVHAQARPETKAALLAQLQHQGKRVAMIGDGINDAPALAQADVGIALGSGTEVAIATADIILVKNCLRDVVKSIRLSRATFGKIQQNLGWACAYNLFGIPIAAGVLLPSYGVSLSPVSAGVMMSFSSIGVILNSLLLRRLPLKNNV
jgi:P-type Cu2+ transporter